MSEQEKAQETASSQVRQTKQGTIRVQVPDVLVDGVERLVIVPSKDGTLRRGPTLDNETYERIKAFAETQGLTMDQLWTQAVAAMMEGARQEKVLATIEESRTTALREVEAARQDAAQQAEQAQAAIEEASRVQTQLQQEKSILQQIVDALDSQRTALTDREAVLKERDAHLARLGDEMKKDVTAQVAQQVAERDRELDARDRDLAVREARLEERERLSEHQEKLLTQRLDWLDLMERRLKRWAAQTISGTPDETADHQEK